MTKGDEEDRCKAPEGRKPLPARFSWSAEEWAAMPVRMATPAERRLLGLPPLDPPKPELQIIASSLTQTPAQPGKRLLGLVNPRTPEGELKDPEQVYRELKAQMDANREQGSESAGAARLST